MTQKEINRDVNAMFWHTMKRLGREHLTQGEQEALYAAFLEGIQSALRAQEAKAKEAKK